MVPRARSFFARSSSRVLFPALCTWNRWRAVPSYERALRAHIRFRLSRGSSSVHMLLRQWYRLEKAGYIPQRLGLTNR